MPKYKHLFFDLDHTLWDFDTNAKLTLEDIFAAYQLHEITKADFDTFYHKYLHHNKIMWDRYQNGYITAEELKWKRMWRTLLEFKVANEVLSKQLSASFLEILPTKTTICISLQMDLPKPKKAKSKTATSIIFLHTSLLLRKVTA